MEENFNNIPQENKVEEGTSQNIINEEPAFGHVESQPYQPEEQVKIINEPSPEPNNEKTKKKGKTLGIIIGAIAILVIAAVGVFFYFRSQRSATKYIDVKLDKLKNSIEDSFSNNAIESIGTLDFMSEESIIDGNLKITANGSTFGTLNGTEIRYNLKQAIDKNYLEGTATIKDSKDSIEGSIYLDNTDIYLNLKDITLSPLVIKSEQNVFTELKNALNTKELDQYKELMDISKLKEFSLKTIEFLGSALKETATSTKQKGLNIEYVYELNKTTVKKALDKFVELIKNDSSYQGIIKDTTGMNELDFTTEEIELEGNIIVKIEVNMFTNDLENLTVTINDKTILSKVDKDQYKLLFDMDSDKNYAILTIKDDYFKAVVYTEGNEYGTFELISKDKENKLNIDIKSMGIKVSLKATEVNKNETKLELNADLTIVKIDLTATIKESNDKINISGSIKVGMTGLFTAGTEEVKLDFDFNYQHGSNIVNKEIITNAKNVNDLTEDELNAMSEKLEAKIENMAIVSFFEELIDSLGLGGQDEYYYPEYDLTEIYPSNYDYNY